MDRTDEIEVREMEIEDLGAVYALGERLYTADKWTNLYRFWDEYEVVDMYSSDGETCLVAILEGKLVGFALGMIIEKRRSSWVYGYLVWLGVDPDVGRIGVGRKLLDELTRLFIDLGARMVVVDTAADNEAAIGFFEKNGFGHREDHVFLSKNLTRHPTYQKKRQRKGRRKTPTLARPPGLPAEREES